MCPDAAFPVKICGKACLTENVSNSMVNFRDHPGTTSFWHAGFRQVSKGYWDERTALRAGHGIAVNQLS